MNIISVNKNHHQYEAEHNKRKKYLRRKLKYDYCEKCVNTGYVLPKIEILPDCFADSITLPEKVQYHECECGLSEIL